MWKPTLTSDRVQFISQVDLPAILSQLPITESDASESPDLPELLHESLSSIVVESGAAHKEWACLELACVRALRGAHWDSQRTTEWAEGVRNCVCLNGWGARK